MSRHESSKLGFVKIIKDATGLGLKEAKDFADDLFRRFEQNVRADGTSRSYVESLPLILSGNFIESRERLCRDLSNLSGGFIVVGREWERQMKLLTLGIGDSSDFKEFISEFLSYKIHGMSIDEVQSEINTMLSVVDKEQIEKMYNKLIEK